MNEVSFAEKHHSLNEVSRPRARARAGARGINDALFTFVLFVFMPSVPPRLGVFLAISAPLAVCSELLSAKLVFNYLFPVHAKCVLNEASLMRSEIV